MLTLQFRWRLSQNITKRLNYLMRRNNYVFCKPDDNP